MSAKKTRTVKRDSSFRITSAVSILPFSGDIQFHNNLGLATKVAKAGGFNVQEKSKDAGLMPYNYEFEKCTRTYSLTVFLDEIGEDENFDVSLSNEEKASRVIAIINAIKDLEMEVKGSLDNAEPLFIVGGLSERRSHVFENIVKVEDNNIVISDELKEKCEEGYHVGVISCAFNNTEDIKNKLNATTTNKFFETIIEEVKEYYK
jgi:CRISPR-associated protein Cst2